MNSRIASIATSLTILGTGCSSAQLAEGKDCEAQAKEFEKTLSEVDVMLSAAMAYIDMASAGIEGSAKSALELRPKIKQKLKQAKIQERELKNTCPNEFGVHSKADELASVPRFTMLITGVRLRIQRLGKYMQSILAEE